MWIKQRKVKQPVATEKWHHLKLIWRKKSTRRTSVLSWEGVPVIAVRTTLVRTSTICWWQTSYWLVSCLWCTTLNTILDFSTPSGKHWKVTDWLSWKSSSASKPPETWHPVWLFTLSLHHSCDVGRREPEMIVTFNFNHLYLRMKST